MNTSPSPDTAVADARRLGRTSAHEPPSHLVPLGNGSWGLWRWFGLRGAGFPAEEVLRLAAPGSARAADRLQAAEELRETRRQEAIAHLREGLEEVDRQERFLRYRSLERLNKGRAPRPQDARGAAIDAFVAAREDAEAARRGFDEVFEKELVELGRELRRVAADERFRMAVTWQNRKAVRTGLDALVAAPADGSRNSAERRHEQMVASYLQRYCTKNDTIGWFGPVGWGSFQPEVEAIVLDPGESLVAKRWVRFENWCVDDLTRVLLGDPEVRPWLVPRIQPFCLLHGDLYIPLEGSPEPLDPETLALLRACDGRRNAVRLADDLVADPGVAFSERQAVLSRLDELAGRGMVLWQPELPLVRRPERALRRLVESIDDPALREPRLAVVEELEAHRDAVAAAAHAAELDRALAELETWFSEVTGQHSTRRAGEAYAGRTLIHEDCLRGLRLEIGRLPLEALAPPLDLVLRSARWFTYELSRRWTSAFAEAHRELRAETGQGGIPLFRFFEKIRPILLEANAPVVAEVAQTMQETWLELLDMTGDERRVERTSEALRRPVEERFTASGPGWKHARQQCPDVILGAASAEAIRRGEFQFVLGEVHLATNTLRTRVASDFHPDHRALLDAMTWDLPEPTVVPWLPRTRVEDRTLDPVGIPLPATSARLDFGLLTEKDLRLSITVEPPGNPEAETAFLGEFVVVEQEGELRVRSLSGRHDFGIMDFFDIAFTAQTTNSFRILPRDRHVPRVTIDRLVVQREMWRLPAQELDFANAKSEGDRFLAVRRWARREGMPRFVFGRSPFETKPFFIDLDSPPGIELLCRIVRGAQERGDADTRLGFSEMLPGLDQCWLTDAQGNRFTSEMRMVAVDLAPGGANAGHPGFAQAEGDD